MELLKFLKRSNRASISFTVTASQKKLLQYKHSIQVLGNSLAHGTTLEYRYNDT